MAVGKPKLDVGSIPKMDADLRAMASTIGKGGLKKPRSKRQIAKLAILRRQRGTSR